MEKVKHVLRILWKKEKLKRQTSKNASEVREIKKIYIQIYTFHLRDERPHNTKEKVVRGYKVLNQDY